jgi:hypothetical protein
MNKTTRLLAVFTLCFVPLTSFASAPWFLDWCITAPYQDFVLRLSYLDSDLVTSRSQSIPRAQLSYGVARNIEIYFKDDELENQYPIKVGNGDTTFGIKTKLFSDRHGNDYGLRYELSIPNATDGLGTDHYGNGLCALVTTPFSKSTTVYWVLGETIPGYAAKVDSSFYGALIAYNLTPKLMVGSEWYGNTPTASGANPEFATAVGLMFTQSDSCKYYARVGHSFEGYSRVSLHIGVQLTFGPH